MAVSEYEGLMKLRDEAGNIYLMYPITRAELVDGLDDLLDKKSDSTHKHTAADITAGTLDSARLPTVNNLTSDSTTAPLSAAQGKKLKQLLDGNVHPLDQITTGTAASVDSYTKAGLYWLNKATVTDTPNGGTGLLMVTTNSTGGVIYQTFVSFNTASGYMATRCYTNSKWYPWDERPAPINNLTSDSTTAPLSAAQGKALKEAIDGSVHPLDQITIGEATSMDDYSQAGLYWLDPNVTNTPNDGYGLLIVMTRGGGVIYQIYITYYTNNGYIATRCYTNSEWYAWDERPAPASYVTQEGTSGAWKYRIWSDGKKECWLKTSIQHEVKQASGSLYYSTTVPYPYPVTFTATPTVYVGVRSPNNRPIWGIPSTPASGANTKSNAYMEFVATVSTTSITSDIYIYACGV